MIGKTVSHYKIPDIWKNADDLSEKIEYKRG